jgi:hypothetical protein
MPPPAKEAGSQSAAQKASKAQSAFEQAFKAAEKAAKASGGLVRVVVDGAKMVCNMTIPEQTTQTLTVVATRSLVEGKPLANVSDVVKDTNIKPWPCKCKLLPSGNDFLPCAYSPASLWIPPVPAESSKASMPNLNKALGVMADAMSRGFSLAQAAGMLGNIMHESDYMRADTEYGGAGRGWLQWTGGRRTSFEAWASRNGLHPASTDANSGYLWHEMAGYDGNHWTSWKGYSYEGFKQTTTAEGSAKYFMEGYERPDPAKAHLDRRQAIAKQLAQITRELAVPEVAVLRCTKGGVIQIVDPNQSTKRAKI